MKFRRSIGRVQRCGVLAIMALLAQDLVTCQAAPSFTLTSLTRSASGQVVLNWTAETNAYANLFFQVESAASIGSGFAPVSPFISETSSLAFTDTVSSAVSTTFYRIAATPAFTAMNQTNAFLAYAATNVDGLNTVGYAGAVFDGRYVYFVPYQNSTSAHGRVLRLDTQGSFTDASSWWAYDATKAVGAGAVGFTGGVFDGRYVYFSPQLTVPPSGELRYDTQGDFTNTSSWTLYDAGTTDGLSCKGFQGAVFDGRYVYYVPHYNTNAAPGGWNGVVLRYDSQSAFTNVASWHAYDAGNTGGLPAKGYSSGIYDGRYVYFVPTVNGVQANGSGVVLRYDTQDGFTNSASWQAYDAGNTGGMVSTIFKGAAFDSRFIYFTPYPNNSNCVVLRYDTQTAFTNSAGWSAFNATNTSGLTTEGYDGAVFDGRFVYFVPYHTAASAFHGRVLRYDSQGAFTNSVSWTAFDASATAGLQTQGYVGAVSDGRYIYFAPYFNGSAYSGNVLRFDSRLPRAIPPTVIGGSNL
jgi:hypothetical protein